MKKFLITLFCTLALAALFAAGENLETLKGLSFSNAKIPVYQGRQLQMVIYADHGKRNGTILNGDGIVLNLIRPDADVDKIGDGWKTQPYKLGAPLDEILAFWKDRIFYSEGVMATKRGDVDQKNRRCYGGDRVYFRSPTIDLNGIGFVADFNRRTIQVNSDIDVVMRPASSDVNRILRDGARIPEDYHYMTATGDTMLIDNNKHQILLIGDAHVRENETTLDGERMTIFLGRDDKKEKSDDGSNLGGVQSGISYILADGDVKMSDGKTQKAYADHLHYDLERNKISLTVDPPEKDGTLEQIKMFSIDPDTGKMEGSLTADHAEFYRSRNYVLFTGHVRAKDKNGTIDCEKLELFLSSATKEESDRIIGGGVGQKIERAVAIGSVHMVDGKDVLDCSRMTLYFQRKDEGKTTPLSKGASKLSKVVCDDRVIGTIYDEVPAPGKKVNATQKMFTDHLVHDLLTNVITLTVDSSARGDNPKRIRLHSGFDAAGTPTSTLTADRADFYRDRNYILFSGNVRVEDHAGTLDSDKLELYLQAAKQADSDRIIGQSSGSYKLDRVIAIGNVKMVDSKSTLDSDKLTMHFTTGKGNKQQIEGLFHSGKSELSTIFAEGHVVGTTTDKDNRSSIFGALGKDGRTGRRFFSDQLKSDVITNNTELHGNVIVRDDATKLSCQDMFIYGKPKQVVTSVADDPDADPFELVSSESYAPSHVMLNNNRELDKIVCEKEVAVTSRQSDGKLACAEGDHGLYLVDQKCFVITCDGNKYCRIRADGRLQKCDRIRYSLEHEEFTGETRPGRIQYTESDPDSIPEL